MASRWTLRWSEFFRHYDLDIVCIDAGYTMQNKRSESKVIH